MSIGVCQRSYGGVSTGGELTHPCCACTAARGCFAKKTTRRVALTKSRRGHDQALVWMPSKACQRTVRERQAVRLARARRANEKRIGRGILVGETENSSHPSIQYNASDSYSIHLFVLARRGFRLDIKTQRFHDAYLHPLISRPPQSLSECCQQ